MIAILQRLFGENGLPPADDSETKQRVDALAERTHHQSTDILRITNRERVKQGLRPLPPDWSDLYREPEERDDHRPA